MKVILDLENTLTPQELASFRDQSAKAGRSVSEHVRSLLFGDRELTLPATLHGVAGSNTASLDAASATEARN